MTGASVGETTELAGVPGDGEIHHATIATPAAIRPSVNLVRRHHTTLRDRLEDMPAILSPFGFKPLGGFLVELAC
ncbi:MAG: hypothetical protein QF507_01730 [Vicinamibacterales bacterium]|nr:hypothetical protein [Vicinamibacterales bacterium]